ncbi:hypothetical protein ACT6QH_04110 [Xanthobacter sp. TB0139]|uniref:hypothetical protein n=1 Tax=Xanthobacter sp. TB0139 TaxID=3459178 RepID=UPI00403A670C
MDVAVFNPDALPVWAAQWEPVERAWLPDGGTISDTARQEIEQVVNAYIRRESIARNVHFQRDIAERINRLRKATATFATALAAFSQGEGSQEARSRLTTRLVADAGDEPHLERVPRDLRDLIHAADMALAHLNEDGTTPDSNADTEFLDVRPFRKWDAWEVMIQGLHEVARKHGLPVAIDNHKIGDGDPVPFIDAIMAIEATLPKEFQRYDTRASLAKAVLRIIRNGRDGDE